MPAAAQARVVGVLTTIFLALSFTILGCLLIENDVNYPAWRVLSAAELQLHHAAIEAGLRWTMFPAMALHAVLGLVLLVWPPAALGRTLVALVLLAFAIVLAISFAVQVPLHAQLSAGGGRPALESLIASHRQLRWPAEAAAALASLAALHRALRRRPRRSRASGTIPDASGSAGLNGETTR